MKPWRFKAMGHDCILNFVWAISLTWSFAFAAERLSASFAF
jgi:hypothetical protein